MEFSLGSDTAGSVRLPAAYNNVFGIRPTFGIIPFLNACQIAKSFDTIGWYIFN